MYDGITQQCYLRARFYNPVIGRFTQEDTYYGDGLNLYEYGRNNPVRYIDPSGHEVRAAAEKNYVNRAVDAMNGAVDQGVNGMLERVYGGKSGLDTNRVEFYLSKSRNNIDSDTVILGSTGKYDVIAEKEGYTYFKMNDDVWSSLEKEAGSNYDDIWKVNQQFIDEQIVGNKQILLSNDPFKGYYFDDGSKRFYQREIDYITDKGYVFRLTDDGLWEAIRK